jgi:hypothetical protein
MTHCEAGINREVAEIKCLIHDLSVERFVNDIIHFHATLNADLEIYGIDQAQVMHGEDLRVLKVQAASQRRAFQAYSNAVKYSSPNRTVLVMGRKYIDTIYSVCELILDPLWGRMDKVLDFLPQHSRSVRSHVQYRSHLSQVAGVHRRIRYFLDEQEKGKVCEESSIAA